MPHTIPLASLAQYPSELTRAERPDGADAEPVVATLRPIDRFDTSHRATLVDATVTDMRAWGAPQAAIDAAESLREPGSYVVVTGQQAGIATGPLYTLYKALGAIRHARELHEQYPEHRFVAVFWIEGDDHDFDEARRIGVIDRTAATRTLAYDDGDRSPRHVGDRTVSPEGLATLTAELRDTLIETEFTPEALAIVAGAYGADGATLASGFARAMYAILGEVPLVMISSRNPRLKWLASDVFAREASDPDALHRALTVRTDELRSLGRSTPITPKAGALFMTDGGLRRAVVPGDDGYTLRDTATRYSREQLVDLARTEPERFSPNVALRPIVQDAILPTAAYVGGPSELAYLEQIVAGYRDFAIEPPSFAPRPFALLLEPKARRALETTGLSLEEVMRGDFDAAARVVDEKLGGAIDASRDRAIASVRAAIGELEAITSRIDPTLEKALGATGAGAEKSVEDFAKRLRTALKRKSQTEIDRLESARELVMPAGHLQERTLNALYFINKFSLERFRAALSRIEVVEGVLQVVEI